MHLFSCPKTANRNTNKPHQNPQEGKHGTGYQATLSSSNLCMFYFEHARSRRDLGKARSGKWEESVLAVCVAENSRLVPPLPWPRVVRLHIAHLKRHIKMKVLKGDNNDSAHYLLFSTKFTIPYTHKILKFIWDQWTCWVIIHSSFTQASIHGPSVKGTDS